MPLVYDRRWLMPDLGVEVDVDVELEMGGKNLQKRGERQRQRDKQKMNLNNTGTSYADQNMEEVEQPTSKIRKKLYA